MKAAGYDNVIENSTVILSTAKYLNRRLGKIFTAFRINRLTVYTIKALL